MRSRLPWILFALSLALNIFFVGGALWIKTHFPHPGSPAEAMEAASKEFDLNPDQQAAFQKFLQTVRMRTRHMRELNQPLLDEAWGELAKPTPDEAVLNRVFDEAAANRRAYQADTSRALREFLATLSSEQRAKVLQFMRDRQKARHVPPFLRQIMP